MRKNIFLILWISISFLLWTCGGQEKTTENEKAKSENSIEESKETDKPRFKMPALTESNVKESLLEYGAQNTEKLVLVSTSLGDMKIRLYEETPLHRANFVYLTKKGFFNGTVFYRILKNFMIQGGAGDFPERKAIKEKLGVYHVPAEFNPTFFHKKGTLAMAKKPDEKPEIGSSPYDFFIVQGEKLSVGQLKTLETQNKKPFADVQKQAYTSIGGVPSLDNVHTVFGEVIEGLEVIDKIAAIKTNAQGYPEQMISIQVKVLD